MRATKEPRKKAQTLFFQADHGWRERLRHAPLREAVSHRSDFGPLKGVPINWTLRMDLHHRVAAKPVLKTYLEIVLSGALLTRHRTMKNSTSRKDRPCAYGCRGEDTPFHRYWMCPRWRGLRQKWIASDREFASLTRNFGIVPAFEDIEQNEVHSIQTYMALIAYESVNNSRKKVFRDGEEKPEFF